MGNRMEIFTDASTADDIIKTSKEFNIDARIVGRVEGEGKKELIIKIDGEEIIY